MQREFDYHQVFENTLSRLKEIQFRGEDVSDVYSSNFFLRINVLKQIPYLGKYAYYPFQKLVNSKRSMMSKFLKAQTNVPYAQAHSQIIRGLIIYYQLEKKQEYLDLALQLSEELLSMRSEDYSNYCWGQPFDWPSNGLIMYAKTPRATVSSQAAMAFLDLYEVTNNEKFLNIAISVCRFYIEDLNQYKDAENDICFSYTPVDNYIIFNASMFAAAVLLRTWNITKIEEFRDFGNRAASFTAKHQNKDGSWYYDLIKNNDVGIIDNYHTGFVVESYLDIRDYASSEFKHEKELSIGLDYYAKNLFTDSFEPKLRNNRTYPIDIQSSAQSIMTFIRSKKKEHKALAFNILNYTLNNLYESESSAFYYRIHSKDKVDKTSYIRWGDSWMLRTIALALNDK